MAYLPLDELRAKFDGAGATAGKKAITYCGTGIAATSDAFALHLLVTTSPSTTAPWRSGPRIRISRWRSNISSLDTSRRTVAD